MIASDQIPPPESSSLDDFEQFLTAAVLSRWLDKANSTSLELHDVETLIDRLARVLRTAAQAAKGALRSRSNALPRHKLRAVAAHVEAHLEAPIRVAELAALVCVSPYHFSRQFRAATGLAPHQYVSLCRMHRAARLLARTELAVGLVAVEVGCADQSHFTNMFRRLFGCAPREFRRAVWDRPGRDDSLTAFHSTHFAAETQS